MDGGEEMVFDFVVIGGGSGGIAAANRAASYGAKVALIEAKKLGGTCVNLGCVPKKIMYCAASLSESIREAQAYGFEGLPSKFRINWNLLKTKRSDFIKRLNDIYRNNLKKNGVEVFNGWGKLLGDNRVQVCYKNTSENITIKCQHLLIATGSHGILPEDTPGYDLGTTSDGFFALDEQPKNVAIVGSGYIGVELSGFLQALGTQVSMFTRKCGVLTHFDSMIQSTLTQYLADAGVNMICESAIHSIEKKPDGMYISFNHNSFEKVAGPFDCLIWAIGRRPLVQGLGLEDCGIKLNDHGAISVDEWQNVCGAPGVYAVGDVTGVHMLTPVAIAAGRKLSDRLFGGKSDAKQDFDNIPSVVFSHPPCGVIGMTEDEASAKYGSANIKVYQSTFNDVYYSMMPLLQDDPTAIAHKVPTKHKLICAGPEERVVGLHMIGRGSDEILQGFGVAIKMGATKADFDRCVAIHPTAAEELVTMK